MYRFDENTPQATILQEIERLSGDSSIHKLALSSHVKRVRAHKFYESLAFEKHGFSFLIQ